MTAKKAEPTPAPKAPPQPTPLVTPVDELVAEAYEAAPKESTPRKRTDGRN